MSLSVVVADDASAEIEEAAVWYEERRAGLGLEYVAAVDRVLQSISDGPGRYPLWKPPWRRASVRRFPFVVFFEIDANRVSVWAVAHTRRRPGYWLARSAPGVDS